jgi:hypothetical protein
VDYGHLCHLKYSQLKILKERMRVNPRCINCPSNSNQWIQIKRWLHGSLRITFHTQLEHPLLRIHSPMIKQRCNQWTWASKPQKFWLTVPTFNISRCLVKLLSQLGYNQYCGYTMPMASSKENWGKWLFNYLISWVATTTNQ